MLPYVSSTDLAEILAIKHGLYLAARIGCNIGHIESDSSFAVETMQKNKKMITARRLQRSKNAISWFVILQRSHSLIAFMKQTR